MEDQQIITIALLKARGLDSLNPIEIKNLSSFFNLSIRESPQEMSLQLKKTISFIILIERNTIDQYITLPKFMRLSHDLRNKICAYIMELYHLFMAQKMALDKVSLKQLQETKSPMDKLGLKLHNMRSGEQRQNGPPMNFGYYPPFGSSNPDFPSQPIPNYMFPYQNYMGSGSMASVYEEYNTRGGMIDNLIIQNQSTPQQPQQQQQFKQEEISQKQSIAEAKNVGEECYCGQTGDENILKCLKCENKFHFKCWQAQNYPDAICPSCRLTTHCYTKLMGKPIFQRRNKVDESSVNAKKIYLDEEQLEILHEYIAMVQSTGQCWIELRFVKITKHQGQKKGGFRSCFPLGLSQAKKIENRKWIELKYKNITKGQFLFFLLVCVTVKDLGQLSMQLQHDHKLTDNSLLSNWLSIHGVETYNLSLMHPVRKQRIAFPVRGPRCDHLECEELKFIYEQGIKKEGRIICSYCGKEYTSYEYFCFDPHIMALLDSIQQNELQLSRPMIDRLLNPGIQAQGMHSEEIR